MDNENMEGTDGGMPEAPAPTPAPVPDEDINISRPGPKIALILVLLLAVGAGAYYYFGVMVPKQELEQSINDVKAEFQKVHDAGWESFWKESQIDIKEMKSNAEFEAKIKEILAVSAVAYARHIREKALPILEKEVPKYKEIKAPAELSGEVTAVANAAESFLTAWNDFLGNLDKYEDYIEAKGKLTESGNHWLGIQGDPENEKFKKGAINYVNLAKCILVDKIMFEMEPAQLRDNLENTCAGDATKKVDWFTRVAADCMPKLLEKNPEADEYYTKTLEKYRKAEMPDTSSVFAVEACLGKGRDALEVKLAEDLFRARVDYGKAQNALLKKIKEELDRLK